MTARTWVAALALAALAACSEDTGIIVEVHGADLAQAAIRIDTMVIVEGDRPDSAAWGGAEREQATIEADLREVPYTVMLRPDGVDDGVRVWMAAIAYDGNGTVIGFGELDQPVGFTRDLVKKVRLDLRPAEAISDGCITKGDAVVWRTDDDCDDDGFDFRVDCDDLDALIEGDLDGDPVVCDPDCDQEDGLVYPGAPERCDGIDSDCDPASTAPPRLCADVVVEEEQIVACRLGQRTCDDVEGTYGVCSADSIDPVANAELCARWAECEANGDEDCFVDAGLVCQVPFAAAGEACLPASAKLAELFGLTECTWRLVGGPTAGTWNVGLRHTGSDDSPTSFHEVCDAELVVTGAGAVAQVIVLEAVTADATLRFGVVLDPTRTDCNPDEPGELACAEVPVGP